MTCDYCGIHLNLGNYKGSAPNGIPITVCKKCYEKLKTEQNKAKKS